MRLTFEEVKLKVDEALKWVRDCEAYLVDHPNDEQMLDELDLAKSVLVLTMQHPDDAPSLTSR